MKKNRQKSTAAENNGATSDVTATTGEVAGSKQTAVANKRRSDEISKTLADDEPSNKRAKDEQPSATSQSSATPQREAETPPPSYTEAVYGRTTAEPKEL